MQSSGNLTCSQADFSGTLRRCDPDGAVTQSERKL